MPMRCPNCRALLDDAFACTNGHRFSQESGVLRLLEDGFATTLRAFLGQFEPIRGAEDKRLLDPSTYPRLPFGIKDHEWRLRRYDLAIIRRLMNRHRSARILDIGAWNGWLSHQLTRDGHRVTGIDYFADRYDGLGARMFYQTTWEAIQMDLLDLSLFDALFDVIILNRCLQFMPDPIAYVRAIRNHLAPSGRLIISGIQCFSRPAKKAAAVAALRQHYQATYGFDVFLRPTKGYLDKADLQRLESLGLRFRLYPQLWLSNAKSLVVSSAPRHYYGVGMAATMKR